MPLNRIEDLINSISTTQTNGSQPLAVTGNAYHNEAEVIRRGRQRQDEAFKPLLQELVERYQNQTDYDKAFDGAQDLVHQNAQRNLGQLERRDKTFGVTTRDEYDKQRMSDIDYQTGLSSAQVATDTAQALREREDSILTGGNQLTQEA